MEKHLFKYADVYMLGHGYGVLQYPHLHNQNEAKIKMLLHPYLGGFDNNEGEIYNRNMVIIVGRRIWKNILE